MLGWELWFAILPGLVLFLYGIEHFSREIQRVAGERFRTLLIKLTKNPFGGALLGALVTAIIQSSTATTVIVVGLVNAGTIPFMQSLGIMFGANIGTTITAQLIAFKLTGFAPIFIVLGFILSIFGGKYRFIGKPLFYFGLVFFSLALVSDAIEPIKSDPAIISLFAELSNVFLAVAAGIIVTIILQSSSVTTGMVVLLAASGLLTLGQAIPIIIGSNIGTTLTSIVAATRMDLFAKRAATAHILFNLGGALLFLPLIAPFADFTASLGGTTAQQVANAHLIFNLTTAIVFLIALQPFKRAIETLVKGDEKEILFHTKYLENGLPEDNKKAFGLIQKELVNSLDVTISLFEDATEFMKTGMNHRFHRVAKLEALNDYLDGKIQKSLYELSKRKLTKKEAERTVILVRISNYIEQLGDLGEDLGYHATLMADVGDSFSPTSISDLKSFYQEIRSNMLVMRKSFPVVSSKTIEAMHKNDNDLRESITKGYKKHLRRLYTQKEYAGSSFVEVISLLENANSHLREIRKLLEIYNKL